MKKFSFLLAMMLVLAFASSAFAAQALISNEDGTNTYLATPKVFNDDGSSEYPYEIYLPNEQAPENYRIHTNYTKNTDACASCHATHTAVGESLLQWYSVYETCMACHDGTVTTTYNVVDGNIGASMMPTFGGAFGTGTEASASNHNATGAMEIAAAPGGSVVAENGGKSWSVEFGCESCHTPHGQGGNARILAPDANYAASARASAAGYSTTGLTASVEGSYYVVRPAVTEESAAWAAYNGYYFLNGYPYKVKISVGGTVYEDHANGVEIFEIDNSEGYTRIEIVNADVQALATPVNVKIIGVPSLKVTMNISGYLQAAEDVEHNSGMNTFCGACHTDYNTASVAAATYVASGYGAGTFKGSASKETGVYSQAHRHQVGFQWHNDEAGLEFERGQKGGVSSATQYGMECLTCHVAHGTNEDYWTRTLAGQAVGANDPRAAVPGWTTGMLVEISGSSALKRMPNMGTCETCHGKGAGNEGYNANTGQLGFANLAATSVDGLMPNTYNHLGNTSSMPAVDKGWVGSDKCQACHKEYVEGWKETGHKTSNHNGGCAVCHSPGWNVMGQPADGSGSIFALDNGQDEGITCEACHGTGARHIAAPSSNNIFNPGKTSTKRQAIECGRCHDMYNNTVADSIGTLSNTSGSAAAGAITTSAMESLSNWSVAFRVYGEDPTKFAIASQRTATSSHYGGAWGYADSKHFLGSSSSAATPNGIVTCNTCHNMHADKAGLLKNSYNQVCSSCHDMTANLVQAAAMPTNAWGRHQIELRDFAHSFKFGPPATIAAADVNFVNLEQAVSGLTPAVTTLTDVFDGTNQTTKNNSLWRTATSGGGIGAKLTVYSDAGKTTQVFNNYDGTWELVAHPVGTVEGTDFHFEPTGAIEFENNGSTYNTGKLAGTYTVKWTSKANPSLSVTQSFTVTH